VTMAVFCYIAPCSLVDIDRCFSGAEVSPFNIFSLALPNLTSVLPPLIGPGQGYGLSNLLLCTPTFPPAAYSSS
jgi:hypothetical protein